MYLYVIIETLLAVVLGVTDKEEPVFAALVNSVFYGEERHTLVKFSSILWSRGWCITLRENDYFELTSKYTGDIIACWAYDDGTIYLAWYDENYETIDMQIV